MGSCTQPKVLFEGILNGYNFMAASHPAAMFRRTFLLERLDLIGRRVRTATEGFHGIRE
jgi:hypothetical protein